MKTQKINCAPFTRWRFLIAASALLMAWPIAASALKVLPAEGQEEMTDVESVDDATAAMEAAPAPLALTKDLPARQARRTHDPADWLDVAVITRDGVMLKGLYCPPADAENGMVVILHPMLGRTRDTWFPFCAKLIDAGHGFFVYDPRGHGDSVNRAGGGAKVNYRDFTGTGADNEWNQLQSDMDDVAEFLRAVFRHRSRQIVLAGASIGANAAIRLGAAKPGFAGVVALSPGLNYRDVVTEDAVKALGEKKAPLFIGAAKGDSYSFDSVDKLAAIYESAAGEGAKIARYVEDGGAHGTAMLGGKLDDSLLAWIKNPAGAKSKD